MSKNIKMILLILLLTILVGCEDQSPETNGAINNKVDEEEVLSIIDSYYENVLNQNYGEAYNYLTEASKNEFPLNEYIEFKEIQKQVIPLVSYEIEGVTPNREEEILVFGKATRINNNQLSEDEHLVINIRYEEDMYKIELGEFFKNMSSWACDYIAFENLYSLEKDFSKIEYLSKKSLKLNPQGHSAYDYLITSYTISGNIDEALKFIKEYLNLYPSMEENKFILSHVYELQGINYLGQYKSDEALTSFKKSLEINPDNYELQKEVDSWGF